MARRSHRPLAEDDYALTFDTAAEPQRARRRRLKARSGDRRAHEVDRSASLGSLERAAKRLKSVRAAERVLSVPWWNMDKAVEAMRQAGVTGTVTNLCGTQRQKVDCRRK